MSKGIGREVDIGIAKESVRGTAVAATQFLPQMNLTFDEQIQQVIDESSVGVIEDSIDANVTEKIAVGTLEGRINNEGLGLLLLNTFGSVSSVAKSAPNAAVFDHTFSVDTSAQHPSLTFSVKEPNSSKEYPLGMIGSLEMNVALNQYALFTAELRAKKGVAATITPVYDATDEKNIFLPQHGIFKTATDLAGLGAAPEIKIRTFTLTITKNIEDDQVIGSLDPADILNKQFMAEGTLELIYDSTTFIDDLLADTKKAMRIDLIKTDQTIGSTSNPTLNIDIAKASFSEVTKPFTNNDIIVQTISFKAHYSLGDAQMIKAVLTNITTGY